MSHTKNTLLLDQTLACAALLIVALFVFGSRNGSSEPIPEEVPVYQGVVDLEFGELEGDPPYIFTTITSVIGDPAGRILVADMGSHEVRVFAPDGRFLFQFGRPGEGPGELTRPCCLSFAPDSTLWLRESIRYSAFRLTDSGADFHKSVRFAHSSVGMFAPVTFDAQGRLVDIGHVTGEERSRLARIHHNPSGTTEIHFMVDAEREGTGNTPVEFARAGMTGTLYIWQPFGPRWIHAHGPNGVWAEAVTSEYSVTLRDSDGGISRITGPQLQGPPLSRSEREQAQARIERDLDRMGSRNHPYDIPNRKQPLASIFFDRSGRLWVEKTGADSDEMREADVYEGTELVARYRWPRRVWASMPWATETTLYGTTPDTLDLRRVARVTFTQDL